MKKSIRQILSLLLSLILLTTAIGVTAEEPVNATENQNLQYQVDLKLPCRSAILIDTRTGTILYEQNPQEKLPIASVTKIMTLLLTMEAIEAGTIRKDELVPISEYAASMGGSQVYLEPGESITLHEVLKAVFVASANDGAVALAELISGSVDSFVALMNDRAAALGMHDTVFCNPTGLDDNETGLSTAHDVALMSKALIEMEGVTDYSSIWIDSIRDGAFGLNNTNKLIRFYSGATGLKTGSTGKAKYCLSATAERNDLRLCAVVLAAESSADRFQSAKTMLDWGFANYAYYQPPTEDFEPIKVWGGVTDRVNVYTTQYGALLKKADAIGLETEIELSKELSAPVEKNQAVGKIIYLKNQKPVHETIIYASEAVEEISSGSLFIRLLRLTLTGAL